MMATVTTVNTATMARIATTATIVQKMSESFQIRPNATRPMEILTTIVALAPHTSMARATTILSTWKTSRLNVLAHRTRV
eukprot:SAG31_NODE_14477_length_804_cov_1.028369_2_plen_80_part_00